MKRKFIAAICTASLLCSSAYAAEQSGINKADALNYLGLFQGTDNGYELDKGLTRAEAIAMVVRYLGAEKDAANGEYNVPFTDVPEWAEKYIGYAYEQGITAGTSDNTFSSNDDVTLNQYLTFLLRVLGYSDTSGDFTWDQPYDLAWTAGLLENGEMPQKFARSDMVDISYNALEAHYKSGTMTISEYLMGQYVFTSAEYSIAKNIAQKGKEEALKNVPIKKSTGGSSKSGSEADMAYSDIIYNMTFYDGMGGTVSEQRIKRGEDAIPPANPIRNGYYFLGWSHSFYNIIGDTQTTAKYAATDSENVFLMNSVNVKHGQEFTVSLDLKGTVKLCSLDSAIEFDDNVLELVDYIPNPTLDIIADNIRDDSEIRFNMVQTKNITKDTHIMDIKFKVKETDKKSTVVKLDVKDAIYSEDKTYDLVDCNYDSGDCVVHIE